MENVANLGFIEMLLSRACARSTAGTFRRLHLQNLRSTAALFRWRSSTYEAVDRRTSALEDRALSLFLRRTYHVSAKAASGVLPHVPERLHLNALIPFRRLYFLAGGGWRSATALLATVASSAVLWRISPLCRGHAGKSPPPYPELDTPL